MLKETFTLPLPPTGNKILRSRGATFKNSKGDQVGSQYSKSKKEWENWIIDLVRYKQKFPGRVWFHYQWHLDYFERRDPDNVVMSCKYIHDALTKAGIIVDDSLKYIKGFQHEFYDLRWQPNGKSKKPYLILIVADYPHINGVEIKPYKLKQLAEMGDLA